MFFIWLFQNLYSSIRIPDNVDWFYYLKIGISDFFTGFDEKKVVARLFNVSRTKFKPRNEVLFYQRSKSKKIVSMRVSKI